MNRLIRKLTYTHHPVTGYVHQSYENGRAPRVRKQQPRWARNAIRVRRSAGLSNPANTEAA